MELNNTQRLVKEISGYTPTEASERNNRYYGIDNASGRWMYLVQYLKAADYKIDGLDLTSAFDFLQTEFESEKWRNWSFMAL